MSDDDLIEECVKSLAKIHSLSYNHVKKILLKGVVKRWDLDENALGAFTMFHPFQVCKLLFDNLCRYILQDAAIKGFQSTTNL